MTRILLGHSIPYPDSLLVNTNEKISRKLKDQEIHACWIKRGDYHSMHKEDVTFCRHPEEAQDVLHEFFFRGIKRAVINRHLVGRHIKFYGVVGQPFFHWYYPFEQQAEAPAEEIGAEESTPSFDEKYLRDVCDNTARILDLVVYGGDCVLEPDGQVKIIDFNDWPSFAPCRKQAAVYIAKAVLALAGSKRNKKK